MMNFKDYDHNYQYIQQQVLSQQRLLQQISAQQAQSSSRRNSMVFADQNPLLNFPISDDALFDDRNAGHYYSYAGNGGGSFSVQNDHPLAFPSYLNDSDGIASPLFNNNIRASNLMTSENLAGLLPSLTSPNGPNTTGGNTLWNPPLSARNDRENSTDEKLPSSPKKVPPSTVDEFLRAAKPRKKSGVSIETINVADTNNDNNLGSMKSKKPIGPPTGLIKTLLAPEKPISSRERPSSSPNVRRSTNYSLIANNKIVI